MQGREQQMPFLRMGTYRDSPGGPVVKTLLPVQGHEFNPWSGLNSQKRCMAKKYRKNRYT